MHFVDHSKSAVFLRLGPNTGRQAQPCIPEAPCIMQSALAEPPPRAARHALPFSSLRLEQGPHLPGRHGRPTTLGWASPAVRR